MQGQSRILRGRYGRSKPCLSMTASNVRSARYCAFQGCGTQFARIGSGAEASSDILENRPFSHRSHVRLTHGNGAFRVIPRGRRSPPWHQTGRNDEDSHHPLEKILESRIAIIDGAMGTTIRTYGMKEADIRGERFKDAKKDLLNNGDLFTLTQPEMIGDIHRRFLEAGADIIETNTFGATSIAQSEFFVDDPREHGGRKDPEFYQKIIDDPFLNDLAWEINEQSARQCREWADRVGNATGRQRFVAGAMGPLTVSLSNSPDADDPGFRVVTFDQVKAAYARAGAGADCGRRRTCCWWRRSSIR